MGFILMSGRSSRMNCFQCGKTSKLRDWMDSCPACRKKDPQKKYIKGILI